MSPARNREVLARRALLIGLVALGFLGTACRVGLYGDGAYFFLQEIAHLRLFLGNPERTFATAVTQAPVLLALQSGVRDIGALSYVHSAGLVLIPTACWWGALWLQRSTRLFWWFAMMWASVYLIVGLCVISESFLTYALVGLGSSLLFRFAHSGKSAFVAAAIPIAVVLLRSYESMLFLGPPLGVLAILCARHARVGKLGNVLTGVVAALFLFATAWSCLSIVDPDNPGGPSASNPIVLFLDPRVWLAALALALFTASGLFRHPLQRSPAAAAAALAVVMLLTGLILQMPPVAHFTARVAVGLLQATLLVVVTWTHFSKRWRLATPSWLIPAGLICILAPVLILTSVQFGGWLHHYRLEVESTRGLVAFERSDVSPEFATYWANPSLSIVLQSDARQGIILNPNDPPPLWEPFDPAQPLRPHPDLHQ